MWLLNLGGADSGSPLMKREKDSGARLIFIITIICYLLLWSQVDFYYYYYYGARLMKRQGEGLIEAPPGDQLVKRAADIEEENQSGYNI